MGIGTGLVLFAVGAIMRFAISVTTTGFNIHTIGVILMIVGAIGFLVSCAFLVSRGGFNGRTTRTETTVSDGLTPPQTVTSEERTTY
jgi:hypothetical protein